MFSIVARKLVPDENCQLFCLCEIFDRVRVEKRIDGLRRPYDRRSSITRCPTVNFSQLFRHHRMAQFFPQIHTPKAHHWVGATVGHRNRQLGILGYS